MLGWTPGTLDSQNVLYDIMGCRDDPKSSRGEANLAGYCNKKLDELADQVLQESDANKRDILIKQGARVLGDGNPKIGAHGKSVLFFHPKDFSGALVEIEQV